MNIIFLLLTTIRGDFVNSIKWEKQRERENYTAVAAVAH